MPVSHFRDGVPAADVRRLYLRNTSGSRYMGVDGSTTPVEFKYTVPEEENLLLSGVTICLMDSFVYPNKFGNLDPLDNGLLFRIMDDSAQVSLDMCDQEPIKVNADFAAIDSGVSIRMAGSAASLFTMAWRAQGDDEPIILPSGHSVSLVVRDDLTTIDYFRALVKGRLYSVST